MGINLGALAGGLAGGFVTGRNLRMQQDRNKREQEREKREQEAHQTRQTIAKFGIRDLERNEPLREKEVAYKGALIEYQNAELELDKTLQQHRREVEPIVLERKRLEAKTGVVAARAAAKTQPDELEIKQQDLKTRVAEGYQKQLAIVWGVVRSGNKPLALKMFNGSGYLEPGTKASDYRIEDGEVPGPDGKPVKTKVITLIGADGKVIKSAPVDSLEANYQRYGAQYKVVNGAIVRIGADGKATPLYEGEQFTTVPEGGSVVSKRTGQPPAGAGVARRGPSSRDTARIDTRVKMAEAGIDKLVQSQSMSRLDPKTQGLVLMSKARAGSLVRSGMNPEQAHAQAWLEANGGRLNPDGTPKTTAVPAAAAGGAAPVGGGPARGSIVPVWK